MSEPGKVRGRSNAFKERIVLRLEAGERMAAVAEEAGVKRRLLYEWRDSYRAMGVAGFNRKRGRSRAGRSGGRSRATRRPRLRSLQTPPRPPRRLRRS